MKLPSRHTVGQVLRFGGIGAVNTLADVGLFTVFVHFGHIVPGIANMMSYGLCILFSFAANSLWTFRTGFGTGAWRRFAVFLVVSLGALALSTGIVAVLSRFVAPVIAKIASVPPVFVWNFVLSRLLVFKTAPETPKV